MTIQSKPEIPQTFSPRQSKRNKSVIKNYTMLTSNVEDLIDIPDYDDIYQPNSYNKRRPKKLNRKIDKNRSHIRIVNKKQIEREKDNQLSFLLQWRQQEMRFIPQSQLESKKDRYLHKHVKNISQSLKTIKSGVSQTELQALFININWSEDKISVKELAQFDFKEILKNGIIFIWGDKQLNGQIMEMMAKKDYVYIENFLIFQLDGDKIQEEIANATQESLNQNQNQIPQYFTREKKSAKGFYNKIFVENNESDPKQPILENLELIKDKNIKDFYYQKPGQFYKESKKELLMFRAVNQKKAQQLELRHQRTSDVVFDLRLEKEGETLDARSRDYVYKMIETLLPKAYDNPNVAKEGFKMLELWAKPAGIFRENWMSISFDNK